MSDLFNHEYEVWLDWIGQQEVLLPIKHNYNKIYDILGFLKWKYNKFWEFFCQQWKQKPFKCVHAYCPIT